MTLLCRLYNVDHLREMERVGVRGGEGEGQGEAADLVIKIKLRAHYQR